MSGMRRLLIGGALVGVLLGGALCGAAEPADPAGAILAQSSEVFVD